MAFWTVFGLYPMPSRASIGVGVQVSPVRLGKVAHAGSSYALPAVQVANTGTQTEWIHVRIQRLSGGTGRTVPPSWIRAGNVPLRLGPHQAARIPLELAVPSDADRGPYLSDVVVAGSAVIAEGSTNFGAAAATKLEFRVTGPLHRSLWPVLPSWTWLAALIIGVLAAVRLAFVRYGLRIRLERTTTSPSRTYRPGSSDG